MLSFVAWGLATLLSQLGLRLFENLMGVVIDPSYFYVCIAFGLIISISHCGPGLGILSCFKSRLRCIDSVKRNRETELQVPEESKERFCYESVCSFHCTHHLKPDYHQTGRFYDGI